MLHKKMQSHFDDESSNYPSDFKTSHTQYLKWKLIKDYVPEYSRCLDIGAANGRHIIPMIKHLSVDGIALDISPNMLKKARDSASSKNMTLSAIVGKGECVPLNDSSCDAAICYSAMLFMENDESCLKEMSRVLKTDGVLIADIHGSFNLGIYYWQRFYKKHNIDNLISHSLKEVYEMVDRADLELIHIYPTGVWMQLGLLPIIGPLFQKFFNKNNDATKPDFDAKISKLLPFLANRWFVVAKKR